MLLAVSSASHLDSATQLDCDYVTSLQGEDSPPLNVVSNTPLDNASGDDVQAHLVFLSEFGPVFTQLSIAVLIRRCVRSNQRL